VVILAAIACSTAFSTAFSTSSSSDSRGYIFKVAGDSGCRLHWTWTGVGRGSILLTGCQTGGVFSFNFAVRGHQHTCTDPNTRVETPTRSLKKCIHTGAWAEISVLCTRRLSGMQWNFCEKHPLTPPPTQPLHLCVCVCVSGVMHKLIEYSNIALFVAKRLTSVGENSRRCRGKRFNFKLSVYI